MRRTLIYLVLVILWAFCLMVGDGEAGVVVPEAEIHRAVSDYVRDLMSDFEGQIEVSVRRQGDLQVDGTGSVELKVRPTAKRASGRSIPVVLEVYRGPALVEEYLMSASVRYYDDVLVAARPVERGEPLTDDVLMTEQREVTAVLGRYVREVSELKEMRAKTRIGAGRQIDPRQVERIPAVERRDRVRIRAQVGAIEASTAGVAMESGAVGDRIVVQNLTSREKLLAEVVGPGVVQVVF